VPNTDSLEPDTDVAQTSLLDTRAGKNHLPPAPSSAIDVDVVLPSTLHFSSLSSTAHLQPNNTHRNMPAPRRSHVIRRRRIDDEGEDEGSITGPQIDDSHSEASLPSDDDGDADDSDLSETDVPDSLGPDDAGTKPNGAVKPVLLKKEHVEEPLAVKLENAQEQSFAATQDTEAMMNGLQISENATTSEAMEFESTQDEFISDPQDASQSDSRRQKNPLDRKRQEHEEYKKKRDADPAFIPTRGQFFMHDTRSGGSGPNGLKPFGRGAGRGREVIGGPFSPAK
jgi:hypothetical protein